MLTIRPDSKIKSHVFPKKNTFSPDYLKLLLEKDMGFKIRKIFGLIGQFDKNKKPDLFVKIRM